MPLAESTADLVAKVVAISTRPGSEAEVVKEPWKISSRMQPVAHPVSVSTISGASRPEGAVAMRAKARVRSASVDPRFEAEMRARRMHPAKAPVASSRSPPTRESVTSVRAGRSAKAEAIEERGPVATSVRRKFAREVQPRVSSAMDIDAARPRPARSTSAREVHPASI